MSYAAVTEVVCPVCKQTLHAHQRRCGHCLRPLTSVPWLAQWLGNSGQLVPVSTLVMLATVTGLFGSFGWLLVLRQAGAPVLAPVQALAFWFVPMGCVLGFDGLMSILSGVDRTRYHLSQGNEARVSGVAKLVLATGCTGLAAWSVMAIPAVAAI